MSLIRTFVSLDISVFRYLLKAMARSHMDYAQSVWALYFLKDIWPVENILRRASKMIPGLKYLNQKDCEPWNYQQKMNRRIRGDMIEVFMILNSKYDVEVKLYLERNDWATRGNHRSSRSQELWACGTVYPLISSKYSGYSALIISGVMRDKIWP